jgi:hypothetical protein
MRNIKDMLVAKGAMLAKVEASVIKGRQVITGPGTSYSGPANPTRLYTYVDGMPWGEDPLSGSLFGDWWRVTAVAAPSGVGKLLATKLPTTAD